MVKAEAVTRLAVHDNGPRFECNTVCRLLRRLDGVERAASHSNLPRRVGSNGAWEAQTLGCAKSATCTVVGLFLSPMLASWTQLTACIRLHRAQIRAAQSVRRLQSDCIVTAENTKKHGTTDQYTSRTNPLPICMHSLRFFPCCS